MAVVTTNTALNELMNKIDTLSDNAKTNPLFQEAKESFLEGLKDFSLTAQEQSLAFSDFMSKTYLGQYDVIIRSSMALDGELAKVLKTKKETVLVHETTVLTMEQINSERLRQQDTKANITLKNQQILVTWESALTEESRRFVLLKASNDNNQIKAAEHKVNYMKVVSDDEDISLTEDIHTAVKTSIDAISATSNLITITNNLPSTSKYASIAKPTEIGSTITVRAEDNFLEVQ
jgi:hypothetical protein